jgi:hypothetical protein
MSKALSLDEKKHQIEGLANAQTILKTLEALEDARTRFVSRWLYELIQNARDSFDPNRALQIEVTISQEEIKFRHNGRPFSDEEILSLIVHGSTKRELQESPIRFGTGFISTHLLSRQVRVSGTLIGESESGRFEFVLDRTGTTDKEILTATDRSYDEFRSSLKASKPGSDWTEYYYRMKSTELLARDVEAQLSAIPFVLAFDQRVNEVSIESLGSRRTFARRADAKTWPDGTPSTAVPLVVVECEGKALMMATLGDDEAKIAVRVGTQGEGKPLEILPPPEIASVFAFLPLLRTGSIGLPAAYHSQSFRPNEDRDGPLLEAGAGVQTTKNKEIFDRCAGLAVELFRRFADLGWRRPDRALLFRAPREVGGWLTDSEWYHEYIRGLFRELSELALIETDDGKAITVARAAIPMSDETLSWQSVAEFGKHLVRNRLPSQTVSETCSRHIGGWIEIFPDPDNRPFTPLDSSSLLQQVRDSGSLEGLWTTLHPAEEFDESVAIDWLNKLIEMIPETHRKSALDGLLPDQKGVFRSYTTVARDIGIEQALKSAHDQLVPEQDSIRSQLLHPGIIGVDALIEREMTLEKFLPQLLKLLKTKAAQSGAEGDAKLRDSCLNTFHWLVKNERWPDFQDSLPTFAYKSDGSETVSKTSAKVPLPVIPKTLWPAGAREFWDVYPSGWVLVDDYSAILDSDDWNAVIRQGLILSPLVSSLRIELTDSMLEEWSLRELPEGVDHAVKGPAPQLDVGSLGQLRTEDFYNSLRSSAQRAARFLRFILEFVAGADSSWARREFIECECGSKHEIVPCEWLNWIRSSKWVPRRRRSGGTSEGSDALGTEAFARLASMDPELSVIAARAASEPLLELLGVNVLEQAVLAVDAARQADLRTNLIHLARLEADDPGAIDEVVKRIEAERLAGERWRDNQALGKLVELLIDEVLKDALKDHNIDVQSNFVGYDRKLYSEGFVLLDEDVGYLDVRLPGIVARIEIKATRSDKISMSYQQGSESLVDPDSYWLCVVALPNPLPNDRALKEVVRDSARFVPRIADVLGNSHAELKQAETLAGTAGFELQHVDQVRYGLSRSVWDSRGRELAEFINLIAEQAGSPNGARASAPR